MTERSDQGSGSPEPAGAGAELPSTVLSTAPTAATPMAITSYRGALGRTLRQATHLSCRCGLAFIAQIYRSLNLQTHPELRELAITGPLNVASCPRCGSRCQAVVPLVIHDEATLRFMLLLDEALLGRELEERAALCQALGRDTLHEIPAYVRDFQVVLGRASLAERLIGPSRESRERELSDRERELEARAQALAARERDLDARAESLAAREAQLARKGREGWRRPSSGLVASAEAPVRPLLAGLVPPRPYSASGSERPQLRTPPGGVPLAEPRLPVGVAGAAERDPTTVTPPAAALEPGASPVWSVASAALPGATPAPESATRAPRPDVTAPEAVAVPGDGQAAAERVAPTSAIAPPAAPATTPITHRERFGLNGDQAILRIAAEQTGRLDERLQLRARLKLHLLPSYPVIELLIYADPASGESDGLTASGPDTAGAIRWTFDGSQVADRTFLDRLGEVFHLLVEVPGRTEPLPLIAPLEENVRLVLERFDALRAQSPWQAEPTAPLFSVALHELAAPGYEGEPGPTLGDDPFPLIPSPSVARLALETVGYWSERGRQDDLLLRGGYPVVTFRRLLARALARAIDFGLVLPSALEEQAHKLGLTTSRPDLLRRQLQSFVGVASHKVANDLGPGEEWENWSRLLRACESAGVAVPEQARQLARTAARRIDEVTGPQGVLDETLLQGASPATLLALLTRREARADAVRTLAQRGDLGHLEVLFRVVRQLSRSEMARVAPALARYGSNAERHLVEALRSRKPHVRLGCAVLLSHIAGRRALMPLTDLLLDEETEAWVKVAEQIADYGAEALAPLTGAARRAVGTVGRIERVARALALLALRGQETAVTRLAQDREPHTQEAARQALQQLTLLQAGRRPELPPAPAPAGGETATGDAAGMVDKDEWDLFCSRVQAGLLAQRRGEPVPASRSAEEEDDGELVGEGDILEAEDLLIEAADGVPVADDAIVDEQPSGVHPLPIGPMGPSA